jgi:transposase-like protein
VLTDIGAVDLAVPRDRNGSFEPKIVRNDLLSVVVSHPMASRRRAP